MGDIGILFPSTSDKDDTLFALVDGTVQFHKGKRDKSVVSVIPEA